MWSESPRQGLNWTPEEVARFIEEDDCRAQPEELARKKHLRLATVNGENV